MQRIAYFSAFGLACLTVFIVVIGVLAELLGLRGMLPGTLLWFLRGLASPLPAPLVGLLPPILLIPLNLFFAWLLVRRLRILNTQSPKQPPASCTGLPAALLVIAVLSLFLMLAGLVASVLLHAGSGVPAGMLGIPAMFLLGPTLFYIEWQDMRTAKMAASD